MAARAEARWQRLLSKLDRESDHVDFYTRRGFRWSDKFPAIAEEIRNIDADQLWLDGEIVVMTEEGKSCFGSLQTAIMMKDQGCLAYYVFDLMHLNGKNLCWEPLECRKRLLGELVHTEGTLISKGDMDRSFGRWSALMALKGS